MKTIRSQARGSSQFAIACGIASLFALSISGAQDRKNLSIDDVITGFENNSLWYYEILLVKGKYTRAFNKCLNSKPADYDWIRANCQKKDGLKNAFECAGDAGLLHIWFVYDSNEQCESVRRPMKDRMDAIRE
jgi:hypothetical protein